MSTPGSLSAQYRPREFRLPGFLLLPHGLVPDGEPTFEEWACLGPFLREAHGAVHWWIGDWLNYGEKRWGGRYTEALEQTGFKYPTLRNDKWVAATFDLSRRRDKLPFEHHKEVAPLPPERQEEILARADDEGWTRSTLRAKVAAEKRDARQNGAEKPSGCTSEDLRALIDRGWRFGVICPDPPWDHDNQCTRGNASGHYETMTVPEIAALPVGELAAPDAQLHLWAVKDFVPQALALLAGWGFAYKSMFVWVKPQMGMGNYWRMAHEVLLLGVRGSCTFRRKDLMSWASIDRGGEHSNKPDQVYTWLEQAGPGPYLEMFGRRPRPGWVVWGKHIERTLFYQGLDSTESQQNGKAS